MVTDGARNTETGKIVQSDGTTPYSPMSPGNSLVNRNTAQLHLVYHTAPAPEMTANFPPPFEVFEHTMFYDIDVLPPTVKPSELKEPKGGHENDKSQKQTSASSVGLSQMSPRAQMIHGVDSSDVQCRQGFELLMKNSDDSAACVHSQSVEKLIQRDWGSFF